MAELSPAIVQLAAMDRTDEQPPLLDQLQLYTCTGEAGAADGDVLSGLFLEPSDLLADAVPG